MFWVTNSKDTNGSLISGSFSLFLKSSKKVPLEFINIQPPLPRKGGPPLEFINQKGSASRFHQPKRGSASRDNLVKDCYRDGRNTPH